MKICVEELNKTHKNLLKHFSCIEKEEWLADLNSKERRRVRNQSKELEDFLKYEALAEQEKNFCTTHLMIDEDTDSIIAYISLCNASVELAADEKVQLDSLYTSVPALKVARLAVSNEYRNFGIGKQLIRYAALVGKEMNNFSGVVVLTLDCLAHRESYYEGIGFTKNQIQTQLRAYNTPIGMRLVLKDYLKNMN